MQAALVVMPEAPAAIVAIAAELELTAAAMPEALVVMLAGPVAMQAELVDSAAVELAVVL
jgi:hypothetical protein